jgi:hypothetical protein
MPQYYDTPNWQNRGKVTLIPRPFIRRLPILKYILPYHVGDKVKFRVHIDKPNPSDSGWVPHGLWERLGNSWKLKANIDKTDTEVEGSRIHSTGDVAYYVAYVVTPDNAEPVFTAEVENWDTVLSKWALIAVTAIITFIVTFLAGITLGIIDIQKAFTLWMR